MANTRKAWENKWKQHQGMVHLGTKSWMRDTRSVPNVSLSISLSFSASVWPTFGHFLSLWNFVKPLLWHNWCRCSAGCSAGCSTRCSGGLSLGHGDLSLPLSTPWHVAQHGSGGSSGGGTICVFLSLCARAQYNTFGLKQNVQRKCLPVSVMLAKNERCAEAWNPGFPSNLQWPTNEYSNLQDNVYSYWRETYHQTFTTDSVPRISAGKCFSMIAAICRLTLWV